MKPIRTGQGTVFRQITARTPFKNEIRNLTQNPNAPASNGAPESRLRSHESDELVARAGRDINLTLSSGLNISENSKSGEVLVHQPGKGTSSVRGDLKVDNGNVVLETDNASLTITPQGTALVNLDGESQAPTVLAEIASNLGPQLSFSEGMESYLASRDEVSSTSNFENDQKMAQLFRGLRGQELKTQAERWKIKQGTSTALQEQLRSLRFMDSTGVRMEIVDRP